MATEREQIDDRDDNHLAWLLTSAQSAHEMRGEFEAALAHRLDLEFAAMNGVGACASGWSSPSTNGSAQAAVAATKSAGPVPTAISGDACRSGFLRRRRWIWAVASAASLLLAAAVWSDPPAWANMMRAIVSTISELTVGGGQDQAARSEANDGQDVADQSPATGIQNSRRSSAPIAVDVRSVVPPPKRTPIDAAKQRTRTSSESTSPAVSGTNWQPFAEPLAVNELSRRVDDHLAALWQANGIHPVGPASDAEFMRRVYLDLTGRIPSVSEVHEFEDDASPNRRELLVERLLVHHDHATHLAAVWRAILLPTEVDLRRFGGSVKFEEWLAERFSANVPYDEIVRELLLATGRVSETGPLLFYAALKLNPEELAARTSRAFLGVRMDCAQCHDHPFDDVSQREFWGFAAYFARISRPRGKMEMTSPVLQVRDNQQGDVTIPESNEVVRPRLPLAATDFEETSEDPPRRKQLVDWLTSPTNGQFARATVNRVWAQLFGRGLVEPVDDMRPANPPLAPEVLDTLSRDFAASGFDLQRLLRALVLTNVYQLSSQSKASDPSRTLYFAQMDIKSLTAEQLYDCISVATRHSAGAGRTDEQTGLLRFSDASRQAFVEQFRAPVGQMTDYHAGIPQALTLMHGGLIHLATDSASSGLLKSLAAPFFSDEQRLDALFLATLSRYPTPAERDIMVKPIASATTEIERQHALGDVLWALLNSAEFTLNH